MRKALTFLFLLFFPSLLFAYSDFVTARSYILLEKNSLEIVEGKDIDKRLAPASTTKVVTALIALEKLKADELIKVPSGVLSIPPSKMGLKPGKKYRAIDLIKGLLVKSANDAAYAIACHISGTEESFARLMNQTARRIGAYQTNFVNASGLFHPEQYTTCRDLALIFSYALDSPGFREILSTRYFDFHDGLKKVRFQNHDRFLFCFEPAIGGKTGFTKASRHSYVGAFEKNGRIYILSILGSEDLWGDALLILRNLFDRLPGEKEIANARARDTVLASYKKKKETLNKPRKKKSYRVKIGKNFAR